MQARPVRVRLRVLSITLFAMLASLLIATGVAWADQPADAGVKNAPKNCNPSDPDGTENGGTDCIGGTSGNEDPDPNQGSGNDSDCEDDNNGVGVPGHCRDRDKCPDINGVQKDPASCAPPVVVDVCPNVDGTQGSVPAGLVMVNGQCVAPTTPASTDVCPNIAGDQATVPAGTVMVNGECVTPVVSGTPDGTGSATPAADGSTPTPGAADAAPGSAGADSAPTATADDTTLDATAGATDIPAGEATAGAADAANGELPFTGAPTWIVAIVGLLLTLTGTMLHRRATRLATASASR